MRVNAMPRDLARRASAWLLALAATCLTGLAALAGDRAEIDLLGYSPDAQFFAFEEFGIQDGSGFAYSNIYVVDLRADAWVAGTPIRVVGGSETEALSAVRAQAAKAASAILPKLAIGEPAIITALIGDGVPGAHGKSLPFGVPGYGAGEVREQHELALSLFPAKAETPCADYFTSVPLGFALSLKKAGQTRQVHQDGTLPASRNCPQDYRIYGVVLPFGATTLAGGVAIISVYAGGFEGLDRRFIAVPLGQ